MDSFYAGGVVAVLSQKLISADKFQRLCECADLPSATNLLREFGYGDATDVQQLLQDEQTKAVNFLKEMTSNTAVTDCFLLNYDYVNAKYMMKSKYMRTQPDNLYRCGLLDVDEMWQHIQVDDYTTLPEPMQQALNNIDLQFVNGNRLPSVIDTELDKALYKDVALRTLLCPLISVRKYFAICADVANVMCWARLTRTGMNITADNFVVGGTVNVKKLADCTIDNVSAMFENKYLESLVKAVVTALKNNDSLEQCAVIAEKLKRNALYEAKDNTTVEPVICYYLSKIAEIDNIRMILICIKNGIDKSVMMQKVKELYV